MLKAFRAYKINGELSEQSVMDEYRFRPCTEQELARSGFVEVITELTHSVKGKTFFRVKKEKKAIPASSVAEKVKTLSDEFEAEHGRKPSRKEKSAFKEKVVIELASRAIPNTSFIDGWYDSDHVVVLSSSASAAEDVLALLRKALGSLPVSHVFDGQKLSQSMQSWFTGSELPENISLGGDAKLSSVDEEKSSATIKNAELSSDDIQALLSGRQVVNLELSIENKARFVVKDDGSIGKISVSDMALDEHNDQVGDTEDDAARMEADLILRADIVDVILGAMSSVQAKA